MIILGAFIASGATKNSIIAYSGLIFLPLIAWKLNTQWPNTENVIAISAALIGIAPAIYIEFSRRANEASEKQQEKIKILESLKAICRIFKHTIDEQEKVNLHNDIPMSLREYDSFVDKILEKCNYSRSFINTASDLQVLDALATSYNDYKVLKRK